MEGKKVGHPRRSRLGSFACPHFMPAARSPSYPGRAIEKVRCVWVGNGSAFFVKFCEQLDGEKKWNRLPRSYIPSDLADDAARPENYRFSFVNEEGKIKVGGGKDIRAPIGTSHAAAVQPAPPPRSSEGRGGLENNSVGEGSRPRSSTRATTSSPFSSSSSSSFSDAATLRSSSSRDRKGLGNKNGGEGRRGGKEGGSGNGGGKDEPAEGSKKATKGKLYPGGASFECNFIRRQ